jgi:cytochrome b561
LTLPVRPRYNPTIVSVEPPTSRYNGGAIALHWIVAALVLANLILGVSMAQMPISPRKLNAYLWHKSTGTTIFLLTSLRLLWRTVRPHPAPIPMPAWQQKAARLSHALLYVLLFAIPLSGWIFSSATGVQVVYLGLVPLPNLVPKDRALAEVLGTLHVTLAILLVCVVAVHVAAALKHHFVDRDAVLRRMLPFARTRDETVS